MRVWIIQYYGLGIPADNDINLVKVVDSEQKAQKECEGKKDYFYEAYEVE